MLSAVTDGVDRDALPPNLRHGVTIDAAGIVGAVREQHHRTQGQRGRFRHHLLQGGANARSRRGRGCLLRLLDALGLTPEAVKTHLEALCQFFQQSGIERRTCRLYAAARGVGDGHAARIVQKDSHYVLLRAKRRDTHGRMPQQEKQ